MDFPWAAWMQAQQQKQQNQQQAYNDIGQAGSNLFNAATTVLQARRQKQLKDQLSNALQQPQQLPEVGPLQPGQDRTMLDNPQANVEPILAQLYPDQFAKSQFVSPLEKSEIAKNNALAQKASADAIPEQPKPPVGYINPQTGEPSYTAKPGFNPTTGISPNEFLTQFESFKNRGQKEQELGMKREEDLEQKMSLALDPNGFRSGQMKQNQVRVDAGQRVMQLLQQTGGNPDPRQMEELAIATQNLLSNSQGSTTEIQALVPKTIRGNINKQIEWLTGNPQGLEQQLFAKRLGETAQREMNLADEQIKAAQVQRLSGFQEFRKMSPQRYNAVLASYGIDPSMIDEKGRFKRKATPTVDQIFSPPSSGAASGGWAIQKVQ